MAERASPRGEDDVFQNLHNIPPTGNAEVGRSRSFHFPSRSDPSFNCIVATSWSHLGQALLRSWSSLLSCKLHHTLVYFRLLLSASIVLLVPRPIGRGPARASQSLRQQTNSLFASVQQLTSVLCIQADDLALAKAMQDQERAFWLCASQRQGAEGYALSCIELSWVDHR